MAAYISLAAKNGSMEGKEFVFIERQVCVVGRSHDCDLRFPAGWEFRSVSRHHCLLDIDPPSIRVRDLASSNGTFVNGVRLGSQEAGRIGCGVLGQAAAERELKDGDELGVADLVFAVHVNAPREDHKPSETHDGEKRVSIAGEANHVGTPDAEDNDPFAFVGCAHFGQ